MTSSEAALTAPRAPAPAGRTRRVVAGSLLILVTLVVGVVLGRVASPGTPTPSDMSAEAGFARDMQTHHGQAVEMALIVRDRSDNAEIRLLALDIATGQTQQQGQMYAWLASWGLAQTSSGAEMEWLSRPVIDGSADHEGHNDHTPGEPMPGVATFAQMQDLENSTGVEAERLFLELMIDHHLGGVDMAEAVLARVRMPLVTTLASGMVTSQSKEISYMTELLAARP